MKTFHDPEAFARVRRLAPPMPATERLLADAEARAGEVLDLTGQAPGPGPSERLLEVWAAAAREPRLLGPVDPRGLAELRSAGARWYERRHGLALDPERELLATSGTGATVAQALLALLAEGEALLAPSPCAPALLHAATVAGAEVIPVPVGPGVDFFDALVAAAERAERRPKGLLVNFPSNPTAAVATPALLENLVRFAEARGLFILSDLAFAEQGLDGVPPSLLGAPGARERTLELCSVSRSLGQPGWRVGLCAGSATLLAALSRVRGPLDRGPFGAVQAAAAAGLEGGDGELEARRARLRQRRDALVRHFLAAGWAVPPPAATPFAWAPLPEPFRALGSVEFARRLLDGAGVAVVPGASYGKAGDGFVRISLDADEPELPAAAERLGAFLLRGPGAR
jgi:alanine-synthesizing transaminase